MLEFRIHRTLEELSEVSVDSAAQPSGRERLAVDDVIAGDATHWVTTGVRAWPLTVSAT